MQTKLLIASLAALTDLGRAADNLTSDDGVTREVHRENTLDFIRHMVNCDVQIDMIDFTYAQRQSGHQDNYLEFTLKDAENCPPMRIEAWIETNSDNLEGASEVKRQVWSSSDVNAIVGKYAQAAPSFKHSRDTSQAGGSQTAHIRIWDESHDDDGGEWDMPLVSHCETKQVPIKCPEFFLLKDQVHISSVEPENVYHQVNFQVDNESFLELCHVAAIVSVFNENDEHRTQRHLNLEELKAFLKSENGILALNHNNVLDQKKCAQVDFVNIDTNESFPQLGPFCQDDMTPLCNIGSITVIDSCTADKPNNSLTIQSHSVMTDFNSVCTFRHGENMLVTETSFLKDGSHYTKDSSISVQTKVGSVQKYTQVMTDMTWETIPVQIKAQTWFGDVSSQSGAPDEFYTCPMICTFQNVSIDVTDNDQHDFTEDKDGNLVHTLYWTVTGTSSDWCGDFTGKIDVSQWDEDTQTGSNELMVPISSKQMSEFYLNNDQNNVRTVKGAVSIPYVTGNHKFVFEMQRLATQEKQETTANYMEHGAACVLDVNFNHSKLSGSQLVELPRYDAKTATVILEGQYFWWANTVLGKKIDPRFCNLDVLELGYDSKNFNSLLQDPITQKDITVVLPKTRDLPDPTDQVASAANNQAKIALIKNGYSHYVELDKQDVHWYATMWYDYECKYPEEDNACTRFYLTEPDLKKSPKTPFNWNWNMSCLPKIVSLNFDFQTTDVAGGDNADTYFTYELGGNLGECGCDTSGKLISANLTATYDLIREGTGFTDIDFSPVMLTKQQLLNGIRDKKNKNWQAPTIPVSFVRQDGDYKIQMTFSELVDPKTCAVKNPATSTSHSRYIKIINVCDVFINDFNFIGSFCDDQVEAINHKFEISYATTKYCSFTVAQVEIPEINQIFQLPMSEQNNFKFQIVQDTKLAQMDYTATASVTAVKAFAKPASKTETKTGKMSTKNCDCSVHTHKSHDLALLSETHSMFSVEQSLDWTLGAYCYGKTLSLEMSFDGQPAKTFSVAEQGSQKIQWQKLSATTGPYESDYMFYLDSTPYSHSPAKIDWVQSCWVDIIAADIKKIGYDDETAFTGTYLDIALSTTMSGNCGSGNWDASLIIQKKLDCDLNSCDMTDALEQKVELENATVNSSIDKNDFVFRVKVDDDGDACYSSKFHVSALSRDGARVDLPISIPEDFYQGMRMCSQEVETCQPIVDKFEWTKKPEEVDGLVTPQFDIMLSVDKPHSKWCQKREARVFLFDKQDNKIGQTYKELSADEISSALSTGLTFTWDQIVPEHEEYYGHIKWVVNNGQSEKDSSAQWVMPKCHLSVSNFEVSHPRILDQDAKAEFDVSWNFRHQPAEWCTNESAILTLADSETNDVLFAFNLSSNDITTSLTSSGMGLTPRIDFVQGQSIKATIKFDDTNNAGAPAVAHQEVNGPKVLEYCDIVVESFCLRGEEVRDGQSMFVFDIKVDKSSACGALSIGLDIIHDDKYTDLPQIDVDPVAVDQSNSCHCSVEVVVPTAGWILSGDFYGQIDIREPKSNLIIVQDSTHHAF